MAQLSGARTARGIWLPVFVVLVLYLPFIGKAFHIDDGNFIQIARAIAPPFGVTPEFSYAWMGSVTDRFNPYVSTHPPGIPLFLKTVAAVSGGYREIPLHSVFLIFPGLLAFGVWNLARKAGVEPAAAVIAVLGSALVLPAGHNLMADLPMTALWTAAAASFLHARDGAGRKWGAAGAAAATFACLAGYQAVLLTPLAGILSPDSERGRTRYARILRWIAIPLSLLAMLLGALALRGTFPLMGALTEVMNGLSGKRLVDKLVTLPIFLGLAALPFVHWSAADAWRRRWPIALAVTWAGGIVTVLVRTGYGKGETTWLAALAVAGVIGVSAALAKCRELEDRRLGLFLFAWMMLVIGFVAAVMPFGAGRYLMPVVPPLLVALLAALPGRRARFVTAALSASLGLFVAVADYQFASAYRDFAKDVAATVGPSRDRVWYIGEWGMHHYMDAEGFRYLTSGSNEPRPNDLVIIAEVPRLWNPSAALGPRLELIEVREARSRWPVHVMNLRTRAGYYSSLWGYHPFAWSSEPVERFGVFRVAR